jgi:hypothetical protein
MPSRPSTTWVGALVSLLGLGILLVALDIIPTAPAKFEAPHWVVGAAGLGFFLAGIAVLTGPPPGTPEAAAAGGRFTSWRAFALGLGIVGSMAVVANWVAFGPGPRKFRGGIGIPFVAISGPTSEWSGRAIFGVGAGLIDLFLLWIVVRGLRDLTGRGR